jgi:peroxiredoxin
MSEKGHETSKKGAQGSPILAAGAKAPDFALHATPDQKVALKEFRGHPVILAFYPADWSPVCSDQLSLLNQVVPEFKGYNGAEVIAISVDGIWCHLAFTKDRKLQFPVLADFEPKGAVSRAYGAYQDAEGESARALFVIDEKGTIVWSYLSPVGVNPGVDGILRALESLHPSQPSPGAKP